MKKLFIVCSLMAALIGVTTFNAVADQIEGAISFSGTSVQNNLDLSAATAFTQFSDVVVSETGGTGDYASIPSGWSVTVTPFKFRWLAFEPVKPLWMFVSDGKTYDFNATGLIITDSTYNTIAMHGSGIAQITGFEDTPGNWYFSANGAGGTASFSASTDVKPVPEPASMLLLGMGLVGIGAFGRRKFKG